MRPSLARLTLSHGLALVVTGALSLAGCGEAADTQAPVASTETSTEAVPEAVDSAGQEFSVAALKGAQLYNFETFGGNGRTCETCHSLTSSGTLSMSEINFRYKVFGKKDPLFRSDASDDGQGNGYTRFRANGTIRMKLELPPWIRLATEQDAATLSTPESPCVPAANPSDRFVIVNRGIPTTNNVPALDPILMADGRELDLAHQAKSAIADHYQATKQPTASQLDAIAQFQRTALFSSPALAIYAKGGPAPKLPAGKTALEKRGRQFFEDTFDPETNAGVCAFCHSGPMLNESNIVFEQAFGFPQGSRFFNVLVSEFNDQGNPVVGYVFDDIDGITKCVSTPDPGVALTNPPPAEAAGAPISVGFGNFKTPTLWDIKNTAPYFHDNSSKTLEDVASHYNRMIQVIGLGPISPSDQAAIVAYMKLL